MSTSSYKSIFAPGLFEGKVALITGGGTGNGACCSRNTLNATVIVAGRKVDALKRVVNEIKARNGKADYVAINIRDMESAAQGVQKVVQQYHRIDILVNSAGGQFYGPAAAISKNGWNSVIDLNLNGTWHMCRSVYDAWMKDHGGNIVCVTADCRNGMPFMAHSGAARAGVSNLVKTLAIEWGPSGVRINSLAPGSIIGNGMNNYPSGVLQRIFSDVAWKNPTGRMGTESEIAAAVTFLVSPAAAYINAKGTDDALFSQEPSTAAYIGYPSDLDIDLPKELEPLLEKYRKPAAKL
ncbi:hypothetical protein BDF19DRAFT_429338 [Syncephalis fuscata]|nr:hypothetical protein BDF19DRAFT_429338 [Syncephalis fuscata]